MTLEKRKPLIAYALSILYLLFVTLAYNSLNPYLLQFGVGFSVLGFGVWLVYLNRSNRPLRFPRILIPIGAYMVLRLAATAWAPFPIVSIEVVLRELILLVGFLFVYNSLDLFWNAQSWENALINFALVFCLIELALAFFWHRNWVLITGSLFPLPPVGYRSPGVFLGHPNVLAGFLNLVAPIIIVRTLHEQAWGRRALWGLGLMLFVPILYFTSSRTGLLAGILGVGATLGFLYLPNLLSKLGRGERKSFWEIVPPRIAISAVVGIAVVSGFAILFLVQSQRISSHAPTLISARSSIWGPALEVILDSPIIGHGPGSFSVFFAQETQIPPGFATSHAHNLLLQTAAETGLLGVGVVLWIIIEAIRVCFRIWRTATPEVKGRLAAYAGAGVAILSHHTLDYLFESPLYNISVYILFALALRAAPQVASSRILRKRAFLLPGSVLVAVFLGSAYAQIGAVDYWKGVNAGRNGKWDIAAEEICNAYEKRPQISLYGFQCSLAHAQLFSRKGDLLELHSALEVQRKALETDPYWPVHWANLAALEWENGELAAASEHMQAASDQAPGNTIFAAALGRMKGALGEKDAALNAFSRALSADAWLRLSPMFRESPYALDAIQLQPLESSPSPATVSAILGQEAYLAQDYDLAEENFKQAMEANPGESFAYAGTALVEQELAMPAAAWRDIRTAIFLNGTRPELLHAAGMIAAAQNRENHAEEYFAAATDQREMQSFSNSYYYRSYNRFFLATDLVPQIDRPDLMVEGF